VGQVARPEALRRVAPRLEEPLARARAIAARLAAARLEDRRLEDQRQRASAALDRVVARMEIVADAAERGNAAGTAAAAAGFRNSVDDLRELPEV
jgi:hypothetical protein